MQDIEAIKRNCVAWIQDFFEKNGADCNAIVGISGGKDSSVVAALCTQALGVSRVIGVLMPCGQQHDIDCAQQLVHHLQIRSFTINIKDAVDAVMHHLPETLSISEQTKINLPARIRMATLYAVSQSCNGRVANTCNLSEDWVGYATRYGDGAGDFSPCSHLTVTEVKALGRALHLPENLIEKTPIDGLCGQSDEEKLGFTYAVLDQYIRTGVCTDASVREKIDRLHRQNLFKLSPIPSFIPNEALL